MKYYYIFIFLLIILAFQIGVSNIKLLPYKDQKIIPISLAQIDSNKTNTQAQSQAKTVDYYARFNCGTIDNDNGPLRPGKYDSDITIFNKQNFPLTVIWKPIEINQENKNNFQAINIQPQSIVNINCAKIFPYSSISNSTLNNGFTEGVALIRISINNGQLTNNFLYNQGSSVIVNNVELGDMVNVDVLHTVNTLSGLKKENLYLKVDFSLEHLSGKITSSSNSVENKNNLTAIFPVETNKIINPISLIKQILNNNSSNNQQSLNNTTIKIIKSQLIANNPTDNHALTFQKIIPTIANDTTQ
jgi:hypothetical protein